MSTVNTIYLAASSTMAAAALRQIMSLTMGPAMAPARTHRPHQLWLVPLILLSAGGSEARAQEQAALDQARLATARLAVQGLGETLKAQLNAAIKAGGPFAAVGVCRTIAPQIAEDQSRTHGLSVGRTALKVRNPANTPDPFERRVLEDFARQIDAGADPAKLEYTEIVTEGGESVLRYMKAIPMAAQPCLTCHGSNLEPALKAEILGLYPDDQATGFAPGELRGAFTVKQKLK